jgi:NAD-dependent deacetylase
VPDLSPDLDRLAQALHPGASALFITGAGLSADSGLPTYRGVGGLYDDQDTDDGVPIEAALSGPMFQTRPALTWRYIHQIEAACRGAAPNAAHRVIAALEGHLSRCWVLTQNVDGLHARAGSRNLIEMHGTVHRLRCTACAWQDTVEDYAHLPALPTCGVCGAVIRPEVVLFEEALPADAARVYERELAQPFDVVVSIGTTAVFPYISQPMWMARRRGALTVEINPGRSNVSAAARLRLETGAAAAFTSLAERLGIEDRSVD